MPQGVLGLVLQLLKTWLRIPGSASCPYESMYSLPVIIPQRQRKDFSFSFFYFFYFNCQYFFHTNSMLRSSSFLNSAHSKSPDSSTLSKKQQQITTILNGYVRVDKILITSTFKQVYMVWKIHLPSWNSQRYSFLSQFDLKFSFNSYKPSTLLEKRWSVPAAFLVLKNIHRFFCLVI